MKFKISGLAILTLGILISVIIRSILIIGGTDVADIKRMYEVGQALLQGVNPYLTPDFYIYPPIWMYIEAGTIQLSNLLHIPFTILIKFWPNLADVLIAVILYKFLLRQKVGSPSAALWSLVYILNPISIIISTSHGQFDAIISLLVLLAIYCLTFHSQKKYLYISALLIGLAIAIKPNPAMLLPLFLIYKKTSLKQKLYFLLFSTIPVGITLLPYLIMSYHETMGSVFSYSGAYDFGYVGILKSLFYQQNASIWPPFTKELLSSSKIAFLISDLLLFLLFMAKKNLVQATLTAYLLFLSLYSGISAQYLSWILPLAILARSKAIIPFSFSATFALLGFYLFFGPEILFGKFLQIHAFQSEYMLIYFIGNLLLWITIVVWSLLVIRKYFIDTFKTLSQIHKVLIIGTLITLIISMLPIFYFAIEIIKQSME